MIISEIITTFSEDDERNFLLLLQKKNRRGDTKNIQLYKLIASGKTKDLDMVLYGKRSRNAFHALCKRLQDNLIDFVASQSFAGETSEELHVLKLLLASRIFFEHKQFKVAWKTMGKAERIATELELYSILNEIYHTKIQYTHLHPSLSLQETIVASEINWKKFQQEQQLNMAYASIKQTLQEKKDVSIHRLIPDTFAQFDIQLEKTLTYKSLFQLMHVTATAARLQSDYHTISPFMMQIYEVISEKQDKADKHLFYHIEVLNLMAHTSFRNKEFEVSEEFCRKMEFEMHKKKGIYFKRFKEKWILIKALNSNYTNRPEEAISLLEGFKGKSLDIHLTLVMCLFQQNKFDEAYQIIKNFHHSDVWYEKKVGWIWVLKKSIIEILLLIEMDRLDMVLSRLLSFKRKYNDRLLAIGEIRVLNFMKLVAQVYDQPKKATTEAFKEVVESSFVWKGVEEEDVFVMSFYAWLKSKMEQKGLYETTLGLVLK